MRRKTTHAAGSTLVVVMLVLMILTVIVGIAANFTTLVGRNVDRTNTLEQAVAIADGCIDWNFAYWRAWAKSTVPITSKLTGGASPIPLPTTAAFPNVSGFTATRANYTTGSSTMVQQCKVIAVDPEWNAMPASATPTPQVGQSATDLTYNYIATAYVTLPAVRGKVVAKVQRVFQKQQKSPWSYAIFYNDPLEIHPGPTFHVTGWVHTNSDLYTAHASLWFEDKVSYGGSWNIGYMTGDGAHTGQAPLSPHYLSNSPPTFESQHDPFDVDDSVFSTTDPNPNNDSYHELIDPPDLGYSDPLGPSIQHPKGERYYDQAGVIITVDATNNVTIGQGNGNGSYTTLSATSGTTAQKALFNMFDGALTANGSIQDNREAATVRTVTLDVSRLTNTSGTATNGVAWKQSFNGVVYIYDSSGSSTAKRGVKIVNGSTIPAGGITIASQNPVYLQGDFNTGANPASNSGDPTTPQAATYSRQSCSILADAVNILSNAWVDSTSTSSLSSRDATNTTVNAAIVAGNVPSSGGNYSGGAENFPRFLEDWSSATLTYYGSMIQLYSSNQSTGVWGKANVYSPPTRQWYFDNNFKTTPPPGTLMTYSYVKGKWSLL